MRYVTVAIRSLLGLIFLVFGLNGFLHRFPNPAILEAVSFFSALLNSHYMLPAMHDPSRWRRAATVRFPSATWTGDIGTSGGEHILLPSLSRSGGRLPLAIVVALLELFLTFQYRAAFAGVFSSPSLK
jgi:hypothetical protein